MFSDYQLAEPPGAPGQRPAASARAFGMADAVGGWLRRPGRQPGFPFLRRLGPRRGGEVAVTMFGLVGLGMLTCAMGSVWKSASWTASRGQLGKLLDLIEQAASLIL
jgi:hypothetical protein